MRMHIGFSFKPKTLLVVLVVILGLVGFCVDAFADPLPEDGGAQLLTDETSDTTETPAGTVVINTVPAAEAAAPETYTYQRGAHTGLAASVESIFGDYQPLMATDSAGNVSAVSGLAGVDFCWIGGCLAFLILFYSFFRLLGGVFLGRSNDVQSMLVTMLSALSDFLSEGVGWYCFCMVLCVLVISLFFRVFHIKR